MKGLRYSFRSSDNLRDEDLKDLCQEALVKILSEYGSYARGSHFTTWAMKVTVNLVLSENREKAWNNVSLESFNGFEAFFDTNRGKSRNHGSD